MSAAEAGIRKRSVMIAGHRTSISLEAPFWDALVAIAARRGIAVQTLVSEVDSTRSRTNLSSALRVFVLADAQAAPYPPGD